MINKENNKYQKAKIGDMIKIYKRVKSDFGNIYEVSRCAKIIDKYNNYIIIEYIPDTNGKNKGRYRECFSEFDFNKLKMEFV